MATEIKVWQIINGKLELIETTMIEAGRKETEEPWEMDWKQSFNSWRRYINYRETSADYIWGSIDFLGIDKSGNLVVIELKRDKLPREVLCQAIDYASNIASWDVNKISEVCTKYTGRGLEDYLSEKFEDVDLEDLTINKTQRILLVGF